MDEDEEAFLARLNDFPPDYDWGILGETAQMFTKSLADHMLSARPLADIFKGKP